MNQSTVLIYADMRFIAKVPRIALLDLMCIRIPFFLFILGGRWRGYNGGINNRSLFQDKPTLCKSGYHLRKQFLLQAVFYQQVAEASYGVPVRFLTA